MTKEKIQGSVYTRRYVYNFHYHLIWSTMYRYQIFADKKLANEMTDMLQMIAADNNIAIEQMEVMPDHVHVLISFPPSKAPTSAIKALKGRSAFIFLKRHPEIRQSEYWGGHLWASSYYMSTFGSMSKEVAENFISNQKYNAYPKKTKKN
ncbi:IS200/IS605 family transposase [Limosilactobacillus mucosae]|uniref:IS200/IS605 family transposase n=1 Tax=Limosilactobacillus mucosae TaxID=97478 RepID=A0AAJ1MAF1_LIMMU|nr:IS200/IS605 family transposase [Limosilactobacillus mucosae]MDC2828944.1 IS200/IS605 family transposase [Limosilactobacillus mucosae]